MARITTSPDFSREEVGLASRNPGMPLEGMRYPVTPVGMHYLLIHFDIPFVDPATYELPITGRVQKPLRLTLDELKARPAVTMPVMMECAGTGRAHLSPRPVSAPWRDEAIGCAEWTGTPLRSLLEEAGLLDDAVEVLFTGHDRGIDQEVEQSYERSLTLEDALREEVILAYEMNGQPLPLQHGFPLRLVVPDWYGMASVKWLKEIKAISEPFEGVQQTVLYHYRQSEEESGTPVTRQNPHALMVPTGDARVPVPQAAPVSRTDASGGPRMVRLRPRRAGGVQRRRRVHLGRCRARRAGRALRLGSVVPRMGCARARRVRAVRPRHGRGREDAAARQR